MWGEVDAIDYRLALDLGMTLADVRALPAAEVEEWRGYYAVKDQKTELANKVARARGG